MKTMTEQIQAHIDGCKRCNEGAEEKIQEMIDGAKEEPNADREG